MNFFLQHVIFPRVFTLKLLILFSISFHSSTLFWYRHNEGISFSDHEGKIAWLGSKKEIVHNAILSLMILIISEGTASDNPIQFSPCNFQLDLALQGCYSHLHHEALNMTTASS
ncbi:hypothetical protein ACJX0J_040607, partial [Zea mays]